MPYCQVCTVKHIVFIDVFRSAPLGRGNAWKGKMSKVLRGFFGGGQPYYVGDACCVKCQLASISLLAPTQQGRPNGASSITAMTISYFPGRHTYLEIGAGVGRWFNMPLMMLNGGVNTCLTCTVLWGLEEHLQRREGRAFQKCPLVDTSCIARVKRLSFTIASYSDELKQGRETNKT